MHTISPSCWTWASTTWTISYLTAFYLVGRFFIWFKFYWSWFKFPVDNKTLISPSDGLVPNRRQTITWTNVDSVHWRLYVSTGFDELTKNIYLGRSPLVSGEHGLDSSVRDMFVAKLPRNHIAPTDTSNQNYSYVIINAMASQITGVSIVCPTVCSCADQRQHHCSASFTFVRESL